MRADAANGWVLENEESPLLSISELAAITED
jgi:hypothetical protein